MRRLAPALLAGLALSGCLNKAPETQESPAVVRGIEETKGQVAQTLDARFPPVPENPEEHNRYKVYLTIFGKPTEREWRIVRGVENDPALERGLREALQVPADRDFNYQIIVNYLEDGGMQVDTDFLCEEGKDDTYRQEVMGAYCIWKDNALDEFRIKHSQTRWDAEKKRIETAVSHTEEQEQAIREFVTGYMQDLPPQKE